MEFHVRNPKHLHFTLKFICTDTVKRGTRASTIIASIHFGSTFLDFAVSQRSLCIYPTPTSPWLLKQAIIFPSYSLFEFALR